MRKAVRLAPGTEIRSQGREIDPRRALLIEPLWSLIVGIWGMLPSLGGLGIDLTYQNLLLRRSPFTLNQGL